MNLCKKPVEAGSRQPLKITPNLAKPAPFFNLICKGRTPLNPPLVRGEIVGNHPFSKGGNMVRFDSLNG